MQDVYEHANWVLMGLGGFLLTMLLVGWYYSKKINNAEDYLVAGRGLGLFVLTGSMFATWFGAATAMGGAGYAYLFGNQGVIFDPWGAALALIIVALFLAKLLRRGRYLTSVDMIQSRYGKRMAMISTWVLILADLGWLAGILLGGGAILAYFTGLDTTTAVCITTGFVVLYTYLGGMWAVAMTDVWQMIILLVGLTLLFAFMLPEVPGGLAALFSNEPANWSGINQWDFFPTSPESATVFEAGTADEYTNEGFMYYTGGNGWVYFGAALATLGLGVLPTQSLMQRFLAAKDEKTGVRAGYISALMYATVGLIPITVGMIYFKSNPDLSIDQAMNDILMLSAVEFLPPVLTVVFIVALTAAIMSSADSVLLAIAALVGENLQKLHRKNTTSEQVLKVTRIAIPVIAIAALALALKFEAIYSLTMFGGMVALVCISIPFVAGFLWKGANNYGALSAVFAGLFSWIAMYFYYRPLTNEMNTGIVEDGVVYTDWAMWDAIYMAGIWGAGMSLVALVVVSLATRRIDAPKPLVDIDGNRISVKGSLGLPGVKSPDPKEAEQEPALEK